LISIKTADFHFDLPLELIAQTPIARRDASRLLTMNRVTGEIAHRHFYELPQLLSPGDCLVLNDSRVLPARLIGKREPSGGSVEVMLLVDKGDKVWECLVRPGRKLREGAEISFGEGALRATVQEVLQNGNRLIHFQYEGIFLELLEQLGRMPLPPYIKEELADSERYQTVYSREVGSAAAPTAGLHFTEELLATIQAMGVQLCYVTLHVGLGTFRPVKVEDPLRHEMHSEYCVMTEEAARIITQTKNRGGRVICVGTTSCRTVESRATKEGVVIPGGDWTNIFIYPGYEFKVTDGLITNFHLPESTLVMLVSAFSTREKVLEAYHEAVRERYRFFSFGDSMFLY